MDVIFLLFSQQAKPAEARMAIARDDHVVVDSDTEEPSGAGSGGRLQRGKVDYACASERWPRPFIG